MKQCSKSIVRRLNDAGFTTRYFVGTGLDVGGKPDPLALYGELFPRVTSIRTWDWEDGDAQYLEGVAEATFDFVHSSHCLEHLVDPTEGLRSWFRVLKPDGHLVIVVPDEDLYEQGTFPSTFNRDHKHTFAVWKEQSWSPRSINLVDLVKVLGPSAEVIKIELLHATYRFGLPRYDQTITPIAECGIELVVRKRCREELEARGRLPGQQQPPAELRVHFNQYREDRKAIIASNGPRPPFTDSSTL